MENCTICDGLLKWLGRLGGVVYYRCQDCGAEFPDIIEDFETEEDDAW